MAGMDERDRAEDIQEGDYVLFDTGRLGSQTGVSIMGSKCIGVFESEDKARAFIQGCMEEENYYPNIWYVNDHGNCSLLDK